MDDSTIRLKAQIDQIAQMVQFGQALNDIANDLEKVSNVGIKFGKSGRIIEVALKGMSVSGSEVSTLFNSKGLKFLREGLGDKFEKDLARANKQLEKMVRDGAKVQRDQHQQNIQWEREEYFAIQKIRELKAAHSAKIAKQEAQDAQDVYLAQKKWHDAQQLLQKRNAQSYEAQLGGTAIRNALGGLPAGAGASQIIKAGNAIMPAITAIQKGQISIATLLNMLQAIKSNAPQSFQAVNAAQQRVYNGLLRYTKLLGTVPNATNTATKGIMLSMNSMLRIFQVQLLHRAFGAILNGFDEGIQKAIQFEYQISRIRTISQDAQLTTGEWANQIKRLASDNNIELLDATAAAYDLISNQVGKGTQAFGTLNEALKFAKITGATAKDSVDLISFALNAFKLKADESHKIAAILFKTIDLGNVTAQEMAQTFGSVAPLAHQAGLSFRDFAANITTLTIQGIKFDTASTLMKNVLKELIAPSKEMQALIKTWGFNSGEAAIKTLGFHGVLKKLQDELGAGGLQRLKEIFPDIRGTLGAIGTFGGENLEIFTQAQEKFKDAIHDYEKANEIIKESPGQELAKSFNEAKIALIGIGDALLDVANKVRKLFPTDFFKTPLDEVHHLVTEVSGLISFIGQGGSKRSSLTEFLLAPGVAMSKQIKDFLVFNPNSEGDQVHAGAEEFRKKQADRLLDEKQNPALAALNAKGIGIGESIKDITGEKTPDQTIKDIEKIIEKSQQLAIKLREHKEQRAFEIGLIDEGSLKRLDEYANKIGQLAGTKEVQDIFNIDFTKIKDFSNFKIFDENNLTKARETFDDILTNAEKINTEINKNINKATDRIADLQKRQDQNRLSKALIGKSPGQQAKIYEEEINKIMLRIGQEQDFDKRSKLFDEAMAFSAKRDALTIKTGKLKRPVSKDDLTDRLNKAAQADAQKFIKENKAREIDLNAIIQQRVAMEERLQNFERLRINSLNQRLALEKAHTAEVQKQLQIQERLRKAVPGAIDRAALGQPQNAGGFAVGGMINGPMGRDNLLIRAHAGEFIVNSDATAKFYPQLIAMNSGFAPRGFANGGPVTNVGDININMATQKSVEANVREIGYRLRREIKRGTVRLN